MIAPYLSYAGGQEEEEEASSFNPDGTPIQTFQIQEKSDRQSTDLIRFAFDRESARTLSTFIEDKEKARGSTVANGTLIAGDNRHFYRVEITQNGRVSFHTTGAVDTYGRLLDENGVQLLSNNNRLVPIADIAPTNFQIDAALTIGTYWVVVESFSAEDTGEYELISNFLSDEGSDTLNARIISLDSTISSTLDGTDTVDFFRIEVLEPGMLILEAGYTIEILVSLISASGEVLHDSRQFPFRTPIDSGTHYLRIHTQFQNSAGEYMIRPRLYPIYPLEPSSTTRLFLKDPSDHKIFSIEVPAPGTLTIQTLGSTDTIGSLYDTQNRLIMYNDNGTDHNFYLSLFTDPQRYYIDVTPGENIIGGSFALQVLHNIEYSGTFFDASPISLEDRIRSEIFPASDSDIFQFSIEQAGFLITDIATARYTELSGELFRGQTTLRQSATSTLESDDLIHTYFMCPLDTGDHYIRITAGEKFVRAIEYTMESRLLIPRPIQEIASIDDAITTAGEFDIYMIGEAEAQQFTIDIHGRIPMQMLFITPDCAPPRFAPPRNGAYYLIVRAHSITDRGEYTLTISQRR